MRFVCKSCSQLMGHNEGIPEPGEPRLRDFGEIESKGYYECPHCSAKNEVFWRANDFGTHGVGLTGRVLP